MIIDEREKLRQFYCDTWEKHVSQKEALSPLEQQIAAVVKEHPEYHALLENEASIHADYSPEMGDSNPFLHMGMHLGLREQVSTNRPIGIAEIYQNIVTLKKDVHEAEHEMIECLAESIWQAQQNQRMPDEVAYLSCLENIERKYYKNSKS